MNTTSPGTSSASIHSGHLWLLSALLVATGCTHNPDIRGSNDGTTGTTDRSSADYISCVKDGIRSDVTTYTQEEGGKTLLFVGNTDPNQATGLLEVSNTQGEKPYSVYQRHAWQDKGRLINAAMQCSRA